MKKFLIIGNGNAVTYKEIFPLIKENKMCLGQNTKGGTRKGNSLVFTTQNKKEKHALSWWYTNIDCQRHKQHLDLYKKYNAEEYPKYDNYDAINIDRSSDIPMDYDGVMGVPITFLDKYCPTQFEIVDARTIALNDKQKNKSTYLIKDADSSINGKAKYARICIKRIS